jgi:hypothetical protein
VSFTSKKYPWLSKPQDNSLAGRIGKLEKKSNYLIGIPTCDIPAVPGYILYIGPKWDEVTGEWRKLHNEEIRDLNSSPSIIRIIKPRRMRWVGHVARMGRRETHIGYWWESQRERDH